MTQDEPQAEPPPGIAHLVARACRGDARALEALLERHAPVMERIAERRLPRRLRRRVSVADVLQESRLVAVRRMAEFEPRGPDSFRNWLLGIVTRKVRESVRAHEGAGKRSIRREAVRGARPDTGYLPGNGPTPSAVMMGAEAAGIAERALAALPDDYRTILVLTRQHHLDLDEAAERMGRTREATRKLLARAMASFARAYDDCRGASRDDD